MRRALTGLLMVCLGLFPVLGVPAEQQDLIGYMKQGNAVLMIRHALAPGIGDPAGFDLEDCSTQRNLNRAGREQARSIGDWLRDQGIAGAAVYSSQWCRCLETARLLDIGAVTPLPALNSFFQFPEKEESTLAAVREFVRDNTRPGELIILVTHQVTITGISGDWVDSGHGKLLRPAADGRIETLGTLSFE